jgi:ketosteroid isomerase-like protein
MPTRQDVVTAAYDAYFAGDPDRALSHCTPDAKWHPLNTDRMDGLPDWWTWGTGSQPLERYFREILPAAAANMDGYAVTDMQSDTIDRLVITRVRSTHGSGVMVFRVDADKLTDIWVMSGTDSVF